MSPMLKVMHSTPQSPTLTPQWEELTHTMPVPAQLDNIKVELDLVMLALEALAGIDNDAMLQAATHLNLESRVPDRIVTSLRLRQSNPLTLAEEGQKKLDVEEARSLVLISCYLAKQQRELIRRAIALMEQLAAENQEPEKASLLGDYLDAFDKIYTERRSDDKLSKDVLTQLALKLLIELLFYSGPAGHRRLWLALLARSENGLGAKVS